MHFNRNIFRLIYPIKQVPTIEIFFKLAKSESVFMIISQPNLTTPIVHKEITTLY